MDERSQKLLHDVLAGAEAIGRFTSGSDLQR